MDPAHNSVNIDMDHSTPGDHESAAECNDHMIQEWCHAALHRLPYKVMPCVMIDALMKIAPQNMNVSLPNMVFHLPSVQMC